MYSYLQLINNQLNNVMLLLFIYNIVCGTYVGGGGRAHMCWKKIYEILLEAGNVGVDNILQKYLRECELMSDLRHLNVMQFLGVFPP